MGPLRHAKFHLNQFTGVGTRPRKHFHTLVKIRSQGQTLGNSSLIVRRVICPKSRGGTSYGKLGEQSIFCSCLRYSSLPQLLGAHVLFALQLRPYASCCDQDYKLLSVDTVLTAGVRFVSFHRSSFRPQEVKPLKSWRAKTYYRPLHRNLERHSPPLPKSI